jgi:hypothetical protein
MATKYPKSAQTGESGVAFVRKVVTDAGGIFRGSETPDIGIDAVIEFLTSGREPSGDVVLVQIKVGQSYIKSGRFYIGADRDHFETWARYAIPGAGIVLDPSSPVVPGAARPIPLRGPLRILRILRWCAVAAARGPSARQATHSPRISSALTNRIQKATDS